MTDHRGRGSILVGLVIVVVGLVLLVDNLDLLAVSLRDALFGIVLLVAGLYLLLTRLAGRRFDRVFLPSVLVLYGALSVLDEVLRPDAMDLFVPLLVILLGLAFLSRPWRRSWSRRGSTR